LVLFVFVLIAVVVIGWRLFAAGATAMAAVRAAALIPAMTGLATAGR